HFCGWIVHRGARKDRGIPTGAAGKNAPELIGDLDLETSQRGSVVVTEWRKLLRAGGDCRQHQHQYYCCKNALHVFLLSCSSIHERRNLRFHATGEAYRNYRRQNSPQLLIV